MNSQCKKDKGDYAKGGSPRHSGGSIRIRRAVAARLGQGAVGGGGDDSALAPATLAQDKVAIADPVRTSTVTVTVGKTEDVRTDQSLANITVGDPDVADVSPLTDHSLSILGKKIGTTRVTVYDTDKKPVGIFDVEVAYDISRLAAEMNVHQRRNQGGVDQRPHHAARHGAGCRDTRQGGENRPGIRPRSDQYGPGDAAAADRAGSALHRGLATPAANSACSGTCSATRVLANTGSGLPASSLPITQPNGAFPAGRPLPAPASCGSNAINPALAPPLSPITAAGVLSRGAAPFGFLVGQLSNRLQIVGQRARNSLGRGPQSRRAEPRGAVGRHRKLPCRRRVSGSRKSARHGTPSFGFQPYGVGLSFTPTVLRDGPHQPRR